MDISKRLINKALLQIVENRIVIRFYCVKF